VWCTCVRAAQDSGEMEGAQRHRSNSPGSPSETSPRSVAATPCAPPLLPRCALPPRAPPARPARAAPTQTAPDARRRISAASAPRRRSAAAQGRTAVLPAQLPRGRGPGHPPPNPPLPPLPYGLDTSRPSPRTKRTRLVPPPGGEGRGTASISPRASSSSSSVLPAQRPPRHARGPGGAVRPGSPRHPTPAAGAPLEPFGA
jgi:hypothetical protein